jgi:zinc transport system substrate-binding protein
MRNRPPHRHQRGILNEQIFIPETLYSLSRHRCVAGDHGHAGIMHAAEPGEKARLTIVASFYPVYIIARNVTANVPGVQVVNLTPPVTGCLHDYSLTTEDMKRLEGADVLLLNGAGMESFTAKIREKYPQLKTATLTDGIKLITHDDHTNPHAWVGISGALAMTANCANALAAIDTEHAAAYRANAQAYTAQLNALKKEMSDRLNRFRGKKIITFHEAFPYFAEEFGLTIAAVIQREPAANLRRKKLLQPLS